MNNDNLLDKDDTEDRPTFGQDAIFERALGRFMIAWADAESELCRALLAYSGVTNAVAKAIFSGSRAKVMIDFIKSIAHNTQMAADRKLDLNHIFPQMTAINTMRDHLAHHASESYSSPKDDPFTRVVTNRGSSRFGNNSGYEMSAQTINAIT